MIASSCCLTTVPTLLGIHIIIQPSAAPTCRMTSCQTLLQDTLEILHFLKPSRQHIKEGLVPDCSKSLLGGGQAFEDTVFLQSSQGMNNNSLHFSPEVVKALIGEPLTEEDLLKVRCNEGACMIMARVTCMTYMTLPTVPMLPPPPPPPPPPGCPPLVL